MIEPKQMFNLWKILTLRKAMPIKSKNRPEKKTFTKNPKQQLPKQNPFNNQNDTLNKKLQRRRTVFLLKRYWSTIILSTL